MKRNRRLWYFLNGRPGSHRRSNIVSMKVSPTVNSIEILGERLNYRYLNAADQIDINRHPIADRPFLVCIKALIEDDGTPALTIDDLEMVRGLPEQVVQGVIDASASHLVPLDNKPKRQQSYLNRALDILGFDNGLFNAAL